LSPILPQGAPGEVGCQLRLVREGETSVEQFCPQFHHRGARRGWQLSKAERGRGEWGGAVSTPISPTARTWSGWRSSRAGKVRGDWEK
jgi:hypothetical protein